MTEIEEFRETTRAWLEENCPEGARGKGQIANGSSKIELDPDVRLWLDRTAERGWTAPTWPVEYSGAELGPTEARASCRRKWHASVLAPRWWAWA